MRLIYNNQLLVVVDVGQLGKLRPIVNRPFGAVANRAQDAILPHSL